MKITLAFPLILFVSIVFGQNSINKNSIITQSFKSEVWIQPSATIKVTERISIEVKDQSYKGKITRRFDGDRHNIFSEIDVISLKKNNKPEPYLFKKNEKGGKLIQFGTEDLPPGVYHYEFQYQIESQIIMMNNNSGKLIWDVNGFNWEFPIDSIVCVIHNPTGVRPKFYSATRGYDSGKRWLFNKGNRIKDGGIAEPVSASKSELVYKSNKGFKPNEGVRIVVNTPDGFFTSNNSGYDRINYERIKLFKSEIWIEPSGKMRVDEHIFVTVLGQKIKRGIVRTFPTKYKNKSGGKVTFPFEVISVTKNNKPEVYHVKNISNGKAIYVGKENILLPHGDYDYKIKYETDGQLGFFDNHDELYWNVNGNDWELYFDSIACIVHLPEGATIKSYTAYSGIQGEQGKDFIIKEIDKHTILFSSNKRYFKGEGLTIAVDWPKGFVEEPSFISQVWKEYNAYVFIALGVLFIGGFYYFTWKKIGVDPPQDVIYPLFYPPNNMSPSALGYISTYGKASNLLTSEIINLAAKKALTIKELSKSNESDFMLIKNDPKDLTKFEQTLFDILFEEENELELHHTNRKIFEAAEELVDKQCDNKNRNNKLFNNNFGFSFLGNVFTLFLFIIGGVICFWDFYFILTLIPVIVFYIFLMSIMQQATNSIGKFILPCFIVIFIFSFGFVNAPSSSVIFVLFCIYLVGVNALFYHLLKAPTVTGQKLMSKIEGFKMYLTIAEEERLKHLHPPDVTQEVFEKYLSYAMALGVENEWAEKFEQYIKSVSIDVDRISITWYRGSSLSHFNASSFSAGLSSSFSRATSASSSTPGSSSGFSSGGSSGGGGGGGGGGGW